MMARKLLRGFVVRLLCRTAHGFVGYCRSVFPKQPKTFVKREMAFCIVLVPIVDSPYWLRFPEESRYSFSMDTGIALSGHWVVIAMLLCSLFQVCRQQLSACAIHRVKKSLLELTCACDAMFLEEIGRVSHKSIYPLCTSQDDVIQFFFRELAG